MGQLDSLWLEYQCVLDDLMESYSSGYVFLAIKQISDQQLLHIKIEKQLLLNEPVLKVYEDVVNEIEECLFDPEKGVREMADLKSLLLKSLEYLKSHRKIQNPEQD